MNAKFLILGTIVSGITNWRDIEIRFLEGARPGNTPADKSVLLERLIDDAIFQLVYFGNKAEQDGELRNWQHVVLPAENFSFLSRAAMAAYYEGRGPRSATMRRAIGKISISRSNACRLCAVRCPSSGRTSASGLGEGYQ